MSKVKLKWCLLMYARTGPITLMSRIIYNK